MDNEEYNLNRKVSDFFDEALGLGLAEDIKHIEKDRYLPGSQIARGGMKSIEIAVDTITGREVAKALLIGTDDPEKVERFFHEARICASLEHPNIVPVYDAGYDNDGQPFFTMRLLGGQTLQKQVKKGQPLTANLIDTYVKICDAVSYAHSQGILHRDLKPDNIQIGDFGEVQVCDWGLACRDGFKKSPINATEDTKEYIIPVTLDGMIKGTPGYFAPEQAASTKQELTATADIYSLGAILYFILTHKSPLEGFDTITSVKKTISGDIPSIKSNAPETPHSLIAICQKAMALDPKDRYQSVEELKADIVKYQHGFPTAAENAGTWDSLKLFIKRNQRTTLLVATFFIIFNTTLIWFLINLSSKEKEARKAEANATQAAELAQKAEKTARNAEASANQAAELAQMSEQETVEAMSKLAVSEQRARQRLEELQSMTKRKDIAAQKAAPRFLRYGRMYQSEFRHHESLENLNHSLELHPNQGPLALESKGKVLMSLLRFKEAKQCFAGLKKIHTSLIPICDQMIKQLEDKNQPSYEDIAYQFSLYHQHKLGNIYLEELIYSPTLYFLSEKQRRQLAVDLIFIFHQIKKTTFEKMKTNIEKLQPQLLYKTGVNSFDLRKNQRIKTHMIRGEKTEFVILPDIIIPSISLKDLSACPNLKKVYFSNKTDLKIFRKLKVQLLNYKDLH